MADIVIKIPLKVVMDTTRLKAVFDDELLSAGVDIGDHVVAQTQNYIDRLPNGELRFTGALRASVTSRARAANGELVVVTGSALDYARYQELGTIRHFVPFHIALSLYNELQRKWGWVVPKARIPKSTAGLTPSKGGMFTATGRRQTYLVGGDERLWLQRTPNSRPRWGVWVSGEPRPFLHPGWLSSVPFITKRLGMASQKISERLGAA